MANKYYLDIQGTKNLIEKTAQLGDYEAIIYVRDYDDPNQDWYNTETGEITVTSDNQRKVRFYRNQGRSEQTLPIESNPATMPNSIRPEELIVKLAGLTAPDDNRISLDIYLLYKEHRRQAFPGNSGSTHTYIWVSTDGRFEVNYVVTVRKGQVTTYEWYFFDHGTLSIIETYICRQDIYIDEVTYDSNGDIAGYTLLPESDLTFFKVNPDGEETELTWANNQSELISIFNSHDSLNRMNFQISVYAGELYCILNASDDMDGYNQDYQGTELLVLTPKMTNTTDGVVAWQCSIYNNLEIEGEGYGAVFAAILDAQVTAQTAPEFNYVVQPIKPLTTDQIMSLLMPSNNGSNSNSGDSGNS